MCALVFKTDLEFWGIDELLMEPWYASVDRCTVTVNFCLVTAVPSNTTQT